MKVYQVLLAEDDHTSAEIFINLLERYNFSVIHVVDGMMALSRVRIKEFDLIICDIMMPHLDGLSFIEKGKEYYKQTPVIMLTSSTDKDSIVRAANLGVSAYILKPVSTDSLLEKIQPLLKLSADSLVDKKQFPLDLNFSSSSLTDILMKIEGIPWKKDKGQIFESFSHFLAGRSTFTDLQIQIDSAFFLEGKALPILEDFLSHVAKKNQNQIEKYPNPVAIFKKVKYKS